MTEEEREVSKTFLKAVNDFYIESETIFQEFDEMRAKYLKGEDVREDLKQFRSKRLGIFMIIDDIFHKEVDLEDKLNRAHVGKEERDKMLEFKNRFADLADELDLLILTELGLGR
jgi:hypothetical protein